ncbi:hypothetical protein D3C85_1792570 [compost metagenome]
MPRLTHCRSTGKACPLRLPSRLSFLTLPDAQPKRSEGVVADAEESLGWVAVAKDAGEKKLAEPIRQFQFRDIDRKRRVKPET